MLSLTRKTDYALVALATLAERRQEPRGVSARAIAEHFGLPVPLLMNILKDLAQARIVKSSRGSQGGYRIAADPAHISVLEVVTAMEGPVRLTPCSDGLPILGQGCGIADCCPIKEPVRGLHERVNRLLEQTTIADLMGTPPGGCCAGQGAKGRRAEPDALLRSAALSVGVGEE